MQAASTVRWCISDSDAGGDNSSMARFTAQAAMITFKTHWETFHMPNCECCGPQGLRKGRKPSRPSVINAVVKMEQGADPEAGTLSWRMHLAVLAQRASHVFSWILYHPQRLQRRQQPAHQGAPYSHQAANTFGLPQQPERKSLNSLKFKNCAE
jgi:hypothetical protein